MLKGVRISLNCKDGLGNVSQMSSFKSLLMSCSKQRI